MWSIFKNNNDWNEKTIVGFIAFLVMCLFALLDLVTGYTGKDLVINEFIYDSFIKLIELIISSNFEDLINIPEFLSR